MSESRRQLLTIGVFFIIVVVAILLYPANVTHNWWNIFQLIIDSVRSLDAGSCRHESQGPQKYERSPYSTVQMGVLLMALGGCMVPVWLQLDLLVSLAVACARSHSHHFSHATKRTPLSLFSALNIFLFQCAVTLAEGSKL